MRRSTAILVVFLISLAARLATGLCVAPAAGILTIHTLVHATRLPAARVAMMAGKGKGKKKKAKKQSNAALPPPAAPAPAPAPAQYDTSAAIPTAGPTFDAPLPAPAPPLAQPVAAVPQVGISASAARRAARREARRGGMDSAGADVARAAPSVTPGFLDASQAAAGDDDVLTSDSDLAGAFVQDPSFASALPTFDDFRARDAARAAPPPPAAEPSWLSSAASPFTGGADGAFGEPPAPTRMPPPGAVPPKSSTQVAQERILELLTFDTIDERPVNEEPYDWTARFIGRGLPNKAGVYPLPYLQSGHMLLLGVLLLSTIVTYPGFPLTEVSAGPRRRRHRRRHRRHHRAWQPCAGGSPLMRTGHVRFTLRSAHAAALSPTANVQVPDNFRAIIAQGLGITFVINAVCAVYARGVAASKEEPVGFWTAKVFLLGGLALGELCQAVPMPQKPRTGRGAGR